MPPRHPFSIFSQILSISAEIPQNIHQNLPEISKYNLTSNTVCDIIISNVNRHTRARYIHCEDQIFHKRKGGTRCRETTEDTGGDVPRDVQG